MQYSSFKNMNISKLGFGTLRLPIKNSDPQDVDYAELERMIFYAYENGVNYFDTAYMYHGGNAEISLGKILERHKIRDKIYLTDKLPYFDWINFEPENIFDTQLARARTDFFDFYLLHHLTWQKWMELKEKGVIEFLEKKKKSGLIKHIGFSFHDDFAAFKRIIDDYEWELCQIQLNFIDTEYQAGLAGLTYAANKDIAVMIMEPLKGGNIVRIDDGRLDSMKEKYGLSDISVAKIALDFLFDRPEITCVLSGMNSLRQIKENVATAAQMTPHNILQNEKDFLKELKEYILAQKTIPCSGCRYCVPGCPVSIDIPEVFALYNNGLIYNNEDSCKMHLALFHENIKNCVECGQCEKSCPQGINIRTQLKAIKIKYF